MWVHVLCVKISRHLLKVGLSPVSYISPGFHAQINLEAIIQLKKLLNMMIYRPIIQHNSSIIYVDATYLLFFSDKFDRNTYNIHYIWRDLYKVLYQFYFSIHFYRAHENIK